MKTIRPIFLVLLMLLCSKISFSQCTLKITNVKVDSVTCFNGSDGKITITATGAKKGYWYKIGDGTGMGWQSSNTFSEPAGNYQITVADAATVADAYSASCLASAYVTIGQPTQLKVTGAAVNTTCSDTKDGSISLAVTGGSGVYTKYAWSRNDTTSVMSSYTTSTITGLVPGLYNVTVTDSRGCTAQMTNQSYKYVPLTLTGLTDNVVAYTSGAASASTTNSVDSSTTSGNAYVFYTAGFGGLTTASPGIMPNSFTSSNSTGEPVPFNIAAYSKVTKSSLRLIKGATATLGIPANKYLYLYVLHTTGNGDGSVQYTVNGASITTSSPAFTGTDWNSGGGNTALSGLYRVQQKATDTSNRVANFKLYQNIIDLTSNASNVSSITFKNNVTNTSVVNIFAVTGAVVATGVRVFPNTVTISQTPTPTITYNPSNASNTFCSGETFALTANATKAGATPTYTWSATPSGSANFSSTTAANPTVTVTGTSNVTISLAVTASSDATCVTTKTSTAATLKLTSGTITPSVSVTGPSSICQGNTATYTATPTNGGTSPTFTWYVNNQEVSGVTGATLYEPYSTSGTQSVYAVLKSSISCAANSQQASASPVSTVVNATTSPSVTIKGWQVPGANTFQLEVNTSQDLGTSPSYQWYKNNSPISPNGTSASYTASNVSSSDVFSLMVGSSATCPAPPYVFSNYTNMAYMLPVKMSSFTLSNSGNLVNVNWVTTMEVNSQSYEIQRSTDASNFVTVGTVASKNAATGGSYSYPDNVPYGGKYYYRIKSVDFDGQYEYSTIQNIDISGTKTDLTISPNPVVSSGLLTGFDAGSTIVILNMNGQVIHSEIANNQSYTVDASRLPSGMYIVRAVNKNGTVKAVKFLKK